MAEVGTVGDTTEDEGQTSVEESEQPLLSLILPLLEPAAETEDELLAEYEAYLSSLSPFTFQQLMKEPERLHDEAEKTKKQMQDLAFSNYKAFIQTAECIRDMKQQVGDVRTLIGGLGTGLPRLSRACEQFCKTAVEITAQRAATQNTLDHHTKLMDILEIPELMETCVRSELYDEALQLEAFTLGLKKKHPDIPIIQCIAEDVGKSRELMLNQLHQKLRDNMALPGCLRAVSHLRRMNLYNETQLRITFLKSRDAWLRSVIESVPSTNPYAYLNKLIDSSRVHVFDIITQYRAIFPDDILGSSSRDKEISGACILHSWLTQKISDFADTLGAYLPELKEGVLIGNILEQSMYYATSLARVGLDFGGLLGPIFERAIYDLFSSFVQTATLRFSQMLKAQKWLAPPKALAAAMLTGLDNDASNKLAPPVVLIDYLPLAVLTNGLLAAFNELRSCALYSLREGVYEVVKVALTNAALAIRDLHKQSVLSDEEREYFDSMCRAAVDVVLPYIGRCLGAIYPPPSSASDNSVFDLWSGPATILRPIYEKDIPSVAVSEASPRSPIQKGGLLDLVSASLMEDDEQPADGTATATADQNGTDGDLAESSSNNGTPGDDSPADPLAEEEGGGTE